MGLGRRQLAVPQRLVGRLELVELLGRRQILLRVLRGLARVLGQPPGLAPLPLVTDHRLVDSAGQTEPRPRRKPIQRRQPFDAFGGLDRAQSVGVEVGAEPAQPGLDVGQRSERVSPGGVGVGRVEHLPPTLPTGCDSQIRKSGGFDEEIPAISYGSQDPPDAAQRMECASPRAQGHAE